jgi:hypothetical protein
VTKHSPRGSKRGRFSLTLFVVGELALRNLRQRETVMRVPSDLPHAKVATDAEVLRFIDHHGLFGHGI